jgi:predicted HAD superfamily Cof-like phosphohydrolase
VVSSLLEEYEELVKALTLKDMAEAADGIVDMIYVLIGIGLRMGLPLKALFAEVHMSNMEKNPAAPGTRGRKAADGSSMKPPGWLPPRVKEILEHVKGEENA